MKVFLAGTKGFFSYIKENPPLYILETFFTLKNDTEKVKEFMKFIQQKVGIENFLLDSGAFTFMGTLKDTKINFEEYVIKYADFINKYNIQYFFELDIDVVVGLEEVERLRKLLEQRTGKKCIPVWHKSRGKQKFDEMIENYKYVAIGVSGQNDSKWSKKQPHIVRYLINKAHKKGCKIHGLGFTRLKIIDEYPFDSVDSTSWLAGERFGMLYQLKHGKMEIIRFDNRRAKAGEITRHNLNEWKKLQVYLGGKK